MFKKILVPVDGSATSQVAVAKAIDLAKAFGSCVAVIYVIDPYPFTGVGTDFAYGQAEYLSAATAEANAAVKAARDAFVAAGVEVESSVVEAHTAWRGIVESGMTQGADLIVMGSHGHGALVNLVVGSVATEVLAGCKTPVLIVR